MVLRYGLCLSVLVCPTKSRDPPPPSRSHGNANSLKPHKPQTPLPDFLLTTGRRRPYSVEFCSSPRESPEAAWPWSPLLGAVRRSSARGCSSVPGKRHNEGRKGPCAGRVFTRRRSIPSRPPSRSATLLVQLDLFPLKSSSLFCWL